MKQIYFMLFSSFLLITLSCSKKDIANNDDTNSTIAQEINPAKTFYANNGGTFKFRLYQFPPTEGEESNNNYHTAEIYKIIDDNGIFSTFAKGSVPAISLLGYSAVLNCQGDYNSATSSNIVGYPNTSANDDFEIDNNHTRLISYNSTSGAHGTYGFVGTRIYVHNPFFSGAISSSSNQGYMHTLNDANFMLSMGYNSNSGRPMLYRYNPSNFSWIGDVVTQMDYVAGSNTNIPMTNDASKVGNKD
jgi:hypothetical protein